jgi:2,3-bisphosphoglycerate-independent phosphoglycerate mutase
MRKKVGLIILDGWGIGDQSVSDAIYSAKTPFMDNLMSSYPNATLITHGESVGLPDGQMGNSEVGHLNIGAGRIVYQELSRINKSIREGEFYKNPVLLDAIAKTKELNSNLHLIGLVSEGGVHSSQQHLHAICNLACEQGVQNVYIHAFTDGRDCDPKSGSACIRNLEAHLSKTTGKIASVIGRYYAMDRDNRWERIKKAYDLLVHGTGKKFESAADAVEYSYEHGFTDEFIEPSIIVQNNLPVATIQENDVVINFNFRIDRPREITIALTQKAFPEFNMQPLNVRYYSMTNYDHKFQNIKVIFEKDDLTNTLGEVIANNHLTQLRIAETEKYPHVTFFFNGGREEPFENESRIMVNSPKVATYDLQPEMSAFEVTEKTINFINEDAPNFFCLNFANPDMVGHTGVYSAIQKAIETVDECLERLVNVANEKGYELLIIADHGNADFAMNEDGTPNTAHSLNPVPIILFTQNRQLKITSGILADVAPSVLALMEITPPSQMTGKTLV